MPGARQTVAVTITFRKSNKNSTRASVRCLSVKQEEKPLPGNDGGKTNPVEQHPVEADGRRAIQEIPLLLWDPKINYRKLNSGSYLGSDKSIPHTNILLSSNTAFNITIIFVPTRPEWSLPADFPKKMYAFTWRDCGKCVNFPA
jgi:hypothetical protein